MAVRSSMTALIQRVSDMIGDPSNVSVTNQQVQDRLDMRRYSARYALLRPEPTLATGGVLNYTDYYANVGHWESPLETADGLYNGSYTKLTPATSDEIVGRWTFALAAPGQFPPVMIVGRYYDLWGAACECLRLRIAQLATLAFDMTIDGRNLRLSQQITTFEALITSYQRKQMPRSIPVIRSDISGSDAGGVTNFGAVSVDEWGE
jgi:hypothetical protein